MNNLKKAIEVKEQVDKKKKAYIDSLDFDKFYNKLAERLSDVSLWSTYIAIKNESILKTLDITEDDKSNKEIYLILNDILKEITSTLTNLGYIIEPYTSSLNIINSQTPIGIKVYWDPKNVSNK